MKRAFVFPGQGSQSVGMGRHLAAADAAARAVMDEVDAALGQRLSQILFDGPEETLTLTENAQPGLMAVSMAVVRALEARAGAPLERLGHYVAGHSLGEYSALTAVGSLDLADAARLLRLRGRAMQAAVPQGEGAMAALLGLDLDAVAEIAANAAAAGVCACANDNAPGQVVVSGDAAAVDRAVALAKERGARRAIRLTVSAPFHCPLMAPAARTMADALAAVPLAAPRLPVVTNVGAAAVSDPAVLREHLIAQVTATVRWRESIDHLAAAGVTQVVELGAGKVLGGLVKRIAPHIETVALHTPEDIDAFAQTL